MENKIKEIEKKVLNICMSIAREGKGALFVIGDNVKYRRLMNQKIEEFSIFGSGSNKLLKTLSLIDGAIILSTKGIVKEYGALIKINKTQKGKGSRHSAAISASKENVCILVSEEEKKVLIYRDSKMVMQIDPLIKGVSTYKAVNILESLGVGAISSIGLTAIAPSFGMTGIAVFPGTIIFGSIHALTKYLEEK